LQPAAQFLAKARLNHQLRHRHKRKQRGRQHIQAELYALCRTVAAAVAADNEQQTERRERQAFDEHRKTTQVHNITVNIYDRF